MWLKSKVGKFSVHWDFTLLVFTKESVVSKPDTFCHLATARKAVCSLLFLRLSQRLSLTLKCPNQRAAIVTTPNSAWKQYTLVSQDLSHFWKKKKVFDMCTDIWEFNRSLRTRIDVAECWDRPCVTCLMSSSYVSLTELQAWLGNQACHRFCLWSKKYEKPSVWWLKLLI